jgi:diacylglycerol O-acyltransferase / wax synthase
MEALSGLDGAFLHLETPETPMHVASLHLFELPKAYKGDFHADIKRLMRSRLHLAPVFTRKLAPMPLQFANPVWVEDEQIDLDHHVRRVRLPRPGTRAQFEDCAARLHAELLDRNRPLWQLVVIDGLQGGQAAYYFKVHHAVVDGQSGVMLAQTLFDLTPKPRRIAAGKAARAEHPGMGELAAAGLKHDVGQYIKLVRHLPGVVKTLVGLFGKMPEASAGRLAQNAAFGPKTALNLPITGDRGFAGASVPLDVLKVLAKVHEAKLNDVVMALCSGMLRRWLAAHGGIPKKPLIAAMPISVREPGNTDYTTQATMAVVNLNTHLADPVKRLRAIRDAAGAVKVVARRAKGLMPTDFPTIGVPWVLHGLATLYGRSGIAKAMPPLANVVISNVPGPQVPLYAAGARMLNYWPMSIVEHGLGLNITVLSYAGTMDFGFTTARNVVADARELSAALMEALDELRAASTAQPAPRVKAAASSPGEKPAAKKRSRGAHAAA